MNYKKEAAKEAAKIIKPNQIIGLGAGSTIAYLVEELSNNIEKKDTLCFVSPSKETEELLVNFKMKVLNAEQLNSIDLYFDGCDLVDSQLNAFKSGGGIHTDEKVFTSMAKEFILLGDTSKYIDRLDKSCPLTVEVISEAITLIINNLENSFDIESINVRKKSDKEAVLTKRGTSLLDVNFSILPELSLINNIKIWPGIIDHSLFYKIATHAILCGAEGTKHFNRIKK